MYSHQGRKVERHKEEQMGSATGNRRGYTKQYRILTSRMSLCLCKVCIWAVLCDEVPGVLVYSNIMSFTPVS